MNRPLLGFAVTTVLVLAACSANAAPTSSPGPAQSAAPTAPTSSPAPVRTAAPSPPAAASAGAPAAPSAAAANYPLNGKWEADFTCQDVVRASVRLSSFLTPDQVKQHVVDELQQFVPSVHLDPDHPCRDAHDQFHRVYSFAGHRMVGWNSPDDVVGMDVVLSFHDDTFIWVSDPGDPDYPIRYKIEGDTATFQVLPAIEDDHMQSVPPDRVAPDPGFVLSFEVAPYHRLP